MKKNILRKAASVALVGAMCISTLAGCNKSAGSTETTTSSGTTAATTTAAQQSGTEATTPSATETTTQGSTSKEAGIAGFQKFDKQVTLQIPVYDRGESGNGCSDVVNNYWTAWVQENFGDVYNIKVEYVPITRSAVMNDYTLLASSQNLPTILAEYDYPKLMEWQANDYLQPIDLEQFKQVAPTYWANMVDNGLDSYTDTADDHYFVLGTRPYGNTTYTFITFYRRDWLDKVGIKDYPTTFQEWLDLYAAIKEAGISDYPAGGVKIAGAGVDQNYGYRTYPQDELTWATTGDYNIPALGTEAQKTLIKRQNVLYNEGYLDPDWYTNDTSKEQENFIAGKAFSWSGYISSNMDVLNAFYQQNPDADLDVVVAKWSEDNDSMTGYSCAAYRPNNVFGAMLGFAWDATEDEILAAEMYLEWLSQPENLFTMQWGIEGTNFEYVDGQPVSLTLEDMTYQQGHNNNVDYWMLVTASKSLGTIEEDVKSVSPVGLPEDFTEDIIANYYGQLAMYQAGQAQSDCLFAQAIEAEAEYATSLQELYATYRTQLTNCPTDQFDALYDELSKEYLAAGYQEVIDGREEAFNAGLTTRLPQ